VRERRTGAFSKPFDTASEILGAVDEEAMKISFGDHVEVTADARGFTVTTHEHD
jgi:hypothetical protein